MHPNDFLTPLQPVPYSLPSKLYNKHLRAYRVLDSIGLECEAYWQDITLSGKDPSMLFLFQRRIMNVAGLFVIETQLYTQL